MIVLLIIAHSVMLDADTPVRYRTEVPSMEKCIEAKDALEAVKAPAGYRFTYHCLAE